MASVTEGNRRCPGVHAGAASASNHLAVLIDSLRWRCEQLRFRDTCSEGLALPTDLTFPASQRGDGSCKSANLLHTVDGMSIPRLPEVGNTDDLTMRAWQ